MKKMRAMKEYLQTYALVSIFASLIVIAFGAAADLGWLYAKAMAALPTPVSIAISIVVLSAIGTALLEFFMRAAE